MTLKRKGTLNFEMTWKALVEGDISKLLFSLDFQCHNLRVAKQGREVIKKSVLPMLALWEGAGIMGGLNIVYR